MENLKGLIIAGLPKDAVNGGKFSTSVFIIY